MRVARDISTASSKILGEGTDEKNFLDGTLQKEDTGPEDSTSSLSPRLTCLLSPLQPAC